MADALINNDPEYQLIDLRSEEEFKKFSIPGAMNIPFDKLFTEEFIPYVDQVARKNVFYSNGTTLSSEAWMLTKQKGYQNNYILAFAAYKSRLGAKQFFTGEGSSSAASSLKPKKPVPRRKKKMVAGGCS